MVLHANIHRTNVKSSDELMAIECDLHDGKFGNTSLSMAYNRYSSMPEDALPFPW